MLFTIGDLPGYQVRTSDGAEGRVRDVYIDDERWEVRCLVVEFGGRFHRRRILVPPQVVDVRNPHDRELIVTLESQDLCTCPPAETMLPVSRYESRRYRNLVAWPALWLSAYATSPQGSAVLPMAAWLTDRTNAQAPRERHLRSVRAMTGHYALALDRCVGHVRDFALGDDWRVQDIVLQTGGWMHHRQTLLSTYWVRRVSWEMSTMFLGITSSAVFALAEGRLSRDRHVHVSRAATPG